MKPPAYALGLPLVLAGCAAAPAQPAPVAVAVVPASQVPPSASSSSAEPSPADAGAPAPAVERAADAAGGAEGPAGDVAAEVPLRAHTVSEGTVIRRGVDRDRKRWRRCYEEGLLRNPQLTGRVVVRFVIGRNGQVSRASDAGSDLPDARVVVCVVDAFRAMTFPRARGRLGDGDVPITFEPGSP